LHNAKVFGVTSPWTAHVVIQ